MIPTDESPAHVCGKDETEWFFYKGKNMKIKANICVENNRSYDRYYSVELENGKTIIIRVTQETTSEGEFERADIMEVKKTAEVKRIPKIIEKIAKEFLGNGDQDTVVTLRKIEKRQKYKPEPEYKTGADDIGGIYDAVWWR